MGSYLFNKKETNTKKKKEEKHDKGKKISPFILPLCCLIKTIQKILVEINY